MLKLECNDENIALSADVVSKGKVIVYPTDTVYGMGCDPYNDSAVDMIFKIKGRMEEKSLPLLCSSMKHVGRIAKLNERAMLLAEKFWPGALTLIAELVDNRISPKVTAGRNTIGVRIPDHECALKLIEKCGGVIVGTSANRSGCSPAKSLAEVLETLHGFDIILYGGNKLHGIESTVLDVSAERIAIIREGHITRARIESVLANV